MALKSMKPLMAVVVPSSPPSGINPPANLGPHGRSLWDRVTREYAIDDAGGIEILFQACAAADRAEELRAAIDRDGAIVQTRAGLRDHPRVKARTGEPRVCSPIASTAWPQS